MNFGFTATNTIGSTKQKLSIISSYFVPTKEGIDTLITLAKMGVEVRILTNSFDATDVGIVHAGYAHWRKQLLAAGVHLLRLNLVLRVSKITKIVFGVHASTAPQVYTPKPLR